MLTESPQAMRRATVLLADDHRLFTEGLVRLLASDPAGRLVTLTGPGGSGKTRLALEAAWEFARRWEGTRGPDMPFQDGLAFIPLAAVSDPAEIIPAIANGVGLTCSAGPEEHRRQLSAFLQPKRMLLVLDNFEQLVDAGSAGLLDELLEGQHAANSSGCDARESPQPLGSRAKEGPPASRAVSHTAWHRYIPAPRSRAGLR